jgi:hypothetical protein
LKRKEIKKGLGHGNSGKSLIGNHIEDEKVRDDKKSLLNQRVPSHASHDGFALLELVSYGQNQECLHFSCIIRYGGNLITIEPVYLN